MKIVGRIVLASFIGFCVGNIFQIEITKISAPQFIYKEVQMSADSTEIMMNGKKYKQPAMIYVEGLTEVWTRHLVSTKGKDSSILFTLVKK